MSTKTAGAIELVHALFRTIELPNGKKLITLKDALAWSAGESGSGGLSWAIRSAPSQGSPSLRGLGRPGMKRPPEIIRRPIAGLKIQCL
jgi:hypothetical protein